MERGTLKDAYKLLWRIFSAVTITSVVAIVAYVIFLSGVIFLANRPPRMSKCPDNMKELAAAVQVYSSDYDDMLPSSAIPGRKYQEAFLSGFGAVPKGADFSLPPKLGVPRVSWAQIIYDHMRSKDIMFCPSDSQKDTYPTINTTGLSYWWKLAVDKAWHGDGCRRKYQKLSDFAHRADQIILYEHACFHAGESKAKNGSWINVAYLDGHVEQITLKNATSENKDRCATNSDGEPMYFNYNPGVGRGLSIDKVPAKYVDPGTYCDRF